jgi:hypothetical protein
MVRLGAMGMVNASGMNETSVRPGVTEKDCCFVLAWFGLGFWGFGVLGFWGFGGFGFRVSGFFEFWVLVFL